MNIPTVLLALIAVIGVGAFVAQPFFTRRYEEGAGRGGRSSAQVLRERADLLAERGRIYAAIRDLDFDYQTNKVSDEDYRQQRYLLVAQGVDVLQRLDGLPVSADDPIETALAALREGAAVMEVQPESSPQPPVEGGFCPNCGAPAAAGDRFCGACGQRLGE